MASVLPPGPWKLPIIGSLHHLLYPLAHPRPTELAKIHGPLMHLMLGEVSIVVVSSAKAAEKILKTHDVAFANQPHVRIAEIITYGCGDTIFAPYENYWRQAKKLCVLELLTSRRVESFAKVREEEVYNLVSSISSSCGTIVNLSKLLRVLTTVVTAWTTFGKKSKEKEMFVSKAGAGFDPSDIFASLSWLFGLLGTDSKMRKIFRRVDRIITNIVDECVKMVTNGEGDEHEEDFLDVLLKMKRCNDLEVPLGRDEVKATIGRSTASIVRCWNITFFTYKDPKYNKIMIKRFRSSNFHHSSFPYITKPCI